MSDLGDVVPLTVDIRDADGALADATAVTLTVTQPDGTAVTPAVAHPSTGRYQVDFLPSQVGRHGVRWVATGNNAAAYTDGFDVRPADPGYLLSLADAKRALNKTGTGDDEELRSLLEAVTAVVEDHVRRAVVRRTVVERVRACYGQRRLMLSHAPVLAVASVVRVDGSASWSPTDLLVDAELGAVDSLVGSFWGDLDVTYTAGMVIVPAHYIEAAKIILRHLWEVQQTPTISRGPFGGEGLPTAPGAGYAVPNRARELLGGRPPLIA